MKPFTMSTLLGLLMVTHLMMHVESVDISLGDICGNKLVGTCPDKINVKVMFQMYFVSDRIFLKVVGGGSSCAEKVPWNVLIELVSGPKLKASGEITIHIQHYDISPSLRINYLYDCTFVKS